MKEIVESRTIHGQTVSVSAMIEESADEASERTKLREMLDTMERPSVIHRQGRLFIATDRIRELREKGYL